MTAARSPIVVELPGLNGTDPLAFLAGLGLLRLLTTAWPSSSVNLAWDEVTFSARLFVHRTEHSLTLDDVAVNAATIARDILASYFSQTRYPSTVIGLPSGQYRDYVRGVLGEAAPVLGPFAQAVLRLAAAFGIAGEPDAEPIAITPFSFTNGQSAMHLFGGAKALNDRKTGGTKMTKFAGLRTLSQDPALSRLVIDAVSAWQGQAGYPSFNWCPTEYRPGAYQGAVSSSPSVPGANVLAFFGLSYFPLVPGVGETRASGFHSISKRKHFVWPLWSTPCADSVVQSLTTTNWVSRSDPDRQAVGVFAVRASHRIAEGKPPQTRYNFGPSFAV